MLGKLSSTSADVGAVLNPTLHILGREPASLVNCLRPILEIRFGEIGVSQNEGYHLRLPIKRTTVITIFWWGLYWVPPIYGNYQIFIGRTCLACCAFSQTMRHLTHYYMLLLSLFFVLLPLLPSLLRSPPLLLLLLLLLLLPYLCYQYYYDS